jgi:hypothetical protein
MIKADQELTHRLCNWSMLPTHNFPVIFHGIRASKMMRLFIFISNRTIKAMQNFK